MRKYVCVYLPVCIHTYLYTCRYMVDVCVYRNMCIYVYICVHISIHVTTSALHVIPNLILIGGPEVVRSRI